MNAILKLRQLGYRVKVEGVNLALTFGGSGLPDPVQVRPLLDDLRQRKAEALNYLTAETAGGRGTDVLTAQPCNLASLPAVPFVYRSEAEENARWSIAATARGGSDPDPLAALETAYEALRAAPSDENVTAYAEAAIRAGLSFYGGGDVDQGAAGWRQWAGIGNSANDQASNDCDPADLTPGAEYGHWHDDEPPEAHRCQNGVSKRGGHKGVTHGKTN